MQPQRGYHPYSRDASRQPRGYPQVPPQQFGAPISPKIDPGEPKREYLIGSGSFGQVWKGKCRGKDVAIKILNKQELDEKTMEEFKREVDIISQIPHPNIVQFMGACFVSGNLMIVTDFIPKGDLEDMLMNAKINLTYVTRMKMARDVAMGMNWLHKANPVCIHRDLKTKNLLVTDDNKIKICDFGLSQVKLQNTMIQDRPNEAKGTPLWMAPEILMNAKFDEKCDVYSFGIVLWCLLTRDEPYKDFNDFGEFRTAICYNHVRPIIPPACEPSLGNLITRCWDGNPANRPSFEQIIPALDAIIVDYAILGCGSAGCGSTECGSVEAQQSGQHQSFGRLFWKSNFLGREQVPWSEFLEAFNTTVNTMMEMSFVQLPLNISAQQLNTASVSQLEEYATRSMNNQRQVELEFTRRYGVPFADHSDEERKERLGNQCLKALLVNETHEEGVQETESVSIERFGEILLWFGPAVVRGEFVLLDRIRTTLSFTWFHGDIDQNVAEDRLRAMERPGGFLVRFSASHPGCFTISQRNTHIEHRRITRTPDYKYQFSNVVSPTLEDLMSSIGEMLGLYQACPGSRFARVLNPGQIGGYVQTSFQI